MPGQVLPIEVVWVGAGGAIERRALLLAPGATLADALAALRSEPGCEVPAAGLAGGRLKAAIFGEHREPGAPLYAGDRIELLGPLRVDPKAARRRRAATSRGGRG